MPVGGQEGRLRKEILIVREQNCLLQAVLRIDLPVYYKNAFLSITLELSSKAWISPVFLLSIP